MNIATMIPLTVRKWLYAVLSVLLAVNAALIGFQDKYTWVNPVSDTISVILGIAGSLGLVVAGANAKPNPEG